LRAGTFTAFLGFLAFGCGPFLRSLYLQLILGYSALKAGLFLIPLEVVIFVLSPISGRIADRYGSRILTSSRFSLKRGGLDLVFYTHG
jgi:MFS family permease